MTDLAEKIRLAFAAQGLLADDVSAVGCPIAILMAGDERPAASGVGEPSDDLDEPWALGA
jgi:hypothetical protein